MKIALLIAVLFNVLSFGMDDDFVHKTDLPPPGTPMNAPKMEQTVPSKAEVTPKAKAQNNKNISKKSTDKKSKNSKTIQKQTKKNSAKPKPKSKQKPKQKPKSKNNT